MCLHKFLPLIPWGTGWSHHCGAQSCQPCGAQRNHTPVWLLLLEKAVLKANKQEINPNPASETSRRFGLHIPETISISVSSPWPWAPSAPYNVDTTWFFCQNLKGFLLADNVILGAENGTFLRKLIVLETQVLLPIVFEQLPFASSGVKSEGMVQEPCELLQHNIDCSYA